jgi:7,8-didemethyl-8-hydroxy-5-deazariboflavin synthase CofH subunit
MKAPSIFPARPGSADIAAALTVKDGGLDADLARAADEARAASCGGRVTFIVNRNINFTNVCAINCLFCGYSVRPGATASYRLSIPEILERIRASLPLGITEACITGGLNPEIKLSDLASMTSAIALEFPAIHIHAFSPMEVAWLSRAEGFSIREVLLRLRDAGLGSMPGTAAEILVDSVREKVCPGKLTTAEWINVIRTAHGLGIRTTATMMFGHLESAADIAQHLMLIRSIQEETGGFTEFVPLPFVPFKTALKNAAAASLDRAYVRRVHAVSRLVLGPVIPDVQVSWTKLGVAAAREMLHAGVSDFGGTLVEENITRLAGGTHGQYLPRDEIVRIIREEGFEPFERDTLYAKLTPC